MSDNGTAEVTGIESRKDIEERRDMLMGLNYWNTFTDEQKEKFRKLEGKQEISQFLEEEKIQLTEEQLDKIVGGLGIETELPEIFDD